MSKIIQFFTGTAIAVGIFIAFAQCLGNQKDGQSHSRNSCYKAGVVEYKPIPIGNQSASEAMLQNVEEYENLMKSAAEQNVDIIVFPEYGITSIEMPPHRVLAKPYLVEIPPFGTVPCETEDAHAVLKKLSCAAKEMKLYTVVNLGEMVPCDSNDDSNCPPDGAYHYNTNVVFDRSGAIVTKYRKLHLYFEPQFNFPSVEYSTFETDFGVEFGVFTCFDIIFAQPAVELVAAKGIKNFVYPTAWVDELPYLMAIQAQSLWAQSNRANLLASGYHNPLRGSMGSGIYSGYHGALNYTFDKESGTRLVISDVPLNDECEVKSFQSNKKEKTENTIPHAWLKEDLSNSTYKTIDPNINYDSLCHLSLCCNIEYDLTPNSDEIDQFKLIAFNGRRTVAAKTDWFEWQVCAVVHCLDETLESCTEKEVKPYQSKFKALRIEAHPVLLEYYHEASEPALSLLDSQFNLIPQSFFQLRHWTDPESKRIAVEAASIGNKLDEIDVKTIALIQRVYNGRL